MHDFFVLDTNDAALVNVTRQKPNIEDFAEAITTNDITKETDRLSIHINFFSVTNWTSYIKKFNLHSCKVASYQFYLFIPVCQLRCPCSLVQVGASGSLCT